MRRYLPVSLAAGTLLLVGLGCNPFQSVQDKVSQKIGEKVAEGVLEKTIAKGSGGKVDVDLKKEGFTFTNKESGEVFSAGDNVKFPDAFPAEVPRYPGGKALSMSMSAEKGDAGYMMETEDKLDKVAGWYESELAKGGWKSASTFESEDTKMLSFERRVNDNKETMSVTLGYGEGKTNIVVSWDGVGKK